ncbi:hypothetical protein CJD44_02745 [Streptomyces sp. alain-838]|nr:hypothetical protein CJD44_02745 [Streptomyces sp. alain-838]
MLLGVGDLFGAWLVPVQDQPEDPFHGHSRVAQHPQGGGAPPCSGLCADHQDLGAVVGTGEPVGGRLHLPGPVRTGRIEERGLDQVHLGVVHTDAAQVLPSPHVAVVVFLVVTGDLGHLGVVGGFGLLQRSLSVARHDCSGPVM